jgi:hypothetical protein
MAIRAKLTTRGSDTGQQQAGGKGDRPARTEEEKAKRRERVAAAKDALKRSVGLKGDHVAPARAALKDFLQRLNEPNQPNDERFQSLVEAPFKEPPKKRERRF